MEDDVTVENSVVNGKETVFSLETFHEQLMSLPTPYSAIEDFITLAQDHEGEVDVVLEFLRMCVTSTDVSILTNHLKDKSDFYEVAIVLNFLREILIRIGDDLGQYESWGLNLVWQFTESADLKELITKNLKVSSKTNHVLLTLRLLTSMVTCSPKAATLVFVSFRKHVGTFQLLLQLTNTQLINDVRTCVVYLFLAYLVANDAGLISKVTKMKDVWDAIFTGLINDKSSTITVILNTLLSTVVENSSILKTVKCSFFSAFYLNCVLKLDHWTPLGRGHKAQVKAGNHLSMKKSAIAKRALTDDELNQVECVREVAFTFVKRVFCGPCEHAIVVSDPSAGTSDENLNPVVGELLSLGGQPFGRLEDTFVAILRSCPDQIVRCLSAIKTTLADPDKGAWCQAIAFAQKVFEAQRPTEILMTAAAEPSLACKLVGVAMAVTSTEVLNGEVLSRFVCHESMRVRHRALKYIETILGKMSGVVEDPLFLACFTPLSDHQNFAAAYRKRFFDELPSLDRVLECWALAFRDLVEDVPDSVGKTEGEEQPEERQQRHDAEGIVLNEHLESILSILVSYTRLAADISSTAVRRLPGELLHRIDLLYGTAQDPQSLVKIRRDAIRLLANSDVRHQNFLVRRVGDRSVVSVLCEAVAAEDDASPDDARLLARLLSNTGLFGAAEREVGFWIAEFRRDVRRDAPNVVAFFVSAVTDLVENAEALIERLRESVLASSVAKDVTEDYKKLIDDILADDCHDAVPEWEPGVRNSSFSPLVLAALLKLKSCGGSEGDCRGEFVASVLTHVVHSQRLPDVVLFVIEQYHEHLPEHFVEYVKSLKSPSDCRTRNAKQLGAILKSGRDLSGLVRQVYLQRALVDVTDDALREFVAELDIDSVPLVAQQILLYVRLLSIGADIKLDLISFFCRTLRHLLSHSEAACSTRCSDVAPIILSHPVAVESFLSDDLLCDGSVTSFALTELVFQALTRVPDVTEFPFLSSRALKFVLKWLRCLKKKNNNKDLPLAPGQIMQPFVGSLPTDGLRTLASSLCKTLAASERLSAMRERDAIDVAQLLSCVVVAISPLRDRRFLTARQIAAVAGFYEEMHARLAAADGTGNKEDLEHAVSCLGASLCRYLRASPLSTLSIDSEFLAFCLRAPTPENQSILSVLFDCNVANFTHFEDWLASDDGYDAVCRQPNGYAGVVWRYVRFVDGGVFKDALRARENTAAVVKWLSKLYVPLAIDTLLEEEEEEDGHASDAWNSELSMGLIVAFVSLHRLKAKRRLEFLERAHAAGKSKQRRLSVACLRALHCVVHRMSPDERIVDDVDPSVTYVKICLQTLRSCRRAADEATWVSESGAVIDLVSSVLDGDQKGNLAGLGAATANGKFWPKFSRFSVRAGLRVVGGSGGPALRLVHALLRCVQANGELEDRHTSAVFHELFLHSNFVPAMLSASPAHSDWRLDLLDLLVFLVRANPSLCLVQHVLLLLEAYSATLCPADDRILTLLFLYERNGVSMSRFMPFFWGKQAQEHYFAVGCCGGSAPVGPGSRRLPEKDVLNLLDKTTMLDTALNFPLELNLNVELDARPAAAAAGGGTPVNAGRHIYDPRFLLPLFCQLEALQSFGGAQKFVACNGLALVLASLGSADAGMRAAGYCVASHLHRIFGKGAQSNTKKLWHFVLDAVRSAVGSVPGARLPNTVTVFLIRTCLLVQEKSAMLMPPLHYLLKSPVLDVGVVPAFSVMFHSLELDHADHRQWVLRTLAQGVRTADDYALLKLRDVFQTVCSFESTALSKDRVDILNLLAAAARIPAASRDMLGIHGYTSYLHSVARNVLDNRDLALLVRIVHDAWHGMKEHSGEPPTDLVTASGKKMAGAASKAPAREFFAILAAVLDRDGHKMTLATFLQFATTLASVLERLRKRRGGSSAGSLMTTPSVKKLMALYDAVAPCDSSARTVPCNEAVLEILMCWQCHTDRRLPDDSGRFTAFKVYVDTLKSCVRLLFQAFQPSGENYGRLVAVCSWLTEHLVNDVSGLVTDSLLLDDGCGVLYSVLRWYEHLLMAVARGKTTSPESEPDVDPTDALASLCALVVALVESLRRAGKASSAARPADNPFLNFLSSDELKSILRSSEACSILRGLHGDDKGVKASSAVSCALMVLEHWFEKPTATFAWKFNSDFGKRSTEQNVNDGGQQQQLNGTGSAKRKRSLENVERKRGKSWGPKAEMMEDC